MKRYFLALLTILVVLSLTTVAWGGGNCSIGVLDTAYGVADGELVVKANIFIKNEFQQPVSNVDVSGKFLNKGMTKAQIVAMAGCTTDPTGKCTIQYRVDSTSPRNISWLPQVGIKITDVTCPNLVYTPQPNQDFVWAIMNSRQ